MSGFDRLSPALAYQIANTLGWRELRPVQDLTIETVLDGKNAVVLAPTAGGKTEAAFFPILSAMDAHDWAPVSVLYLSPIRALLNNQEERVRAYAAMVGRRVFKWHGDTPQSERARFLREPADVLLITPESLEAMLMSSRIPARELFSGLEAVIVDEVHAFADDDRGAHLSALLERLSRYCARDVQRIGLSATVGNPEEILHWLTGRSKREGAVVSPPRPASEGEVALDYVGNMENAAHVVARLHPGKKRLVFVDSRRGVEELGKLLNDSGVNSYVTHGSLSMPARRDAERAFAEGQDCVIVATSALELGIDVGDLDHVIQIDSPSSVASFLQRMGRTGRRAGTRANCTFLVTKDAQILQAAGIVALHRQGFVEDVKPNRRASHILAHQLMALSVQQGGVAVGDWWAWLEGATPFADLEPDERRAVFEHMLENDILVDHGGRIFLGPRGEQLYGHANFRELYAVFSTPRVITVLHSAHEIGTVDSRFLLGIDADSQRGAFVLGGRPWQVQHIDWQRGRCTVTPADHARAPRWSGAPRFLGYELCQAMRQVLVTDDIDPAWSRRATELLSSLREEHRFLRDEPCPMEQEAKAITWWTFAGGRANTLLASMIESELGLAVEGDQPSRGKITVRNTSITFAEDAGQSVVALREAVRNLAGAGRPNEEDARRFAPEASRERLGKFEPCLPERLAEDLAAETGLDVEGARATLGKCPPEAGG